MKVSSRPLLQVAIDVLNTPQALKIVGQIHPHLDIVEIGTPLIIEEGLSALETIKSKFPDKKYLADLKIMDAGKLEASSAFRRGADIVTVLAAADDQTIGGALEAANSHGGQVMADLINVPDLDRRAVELAALGVPILCLHTASDRRDLGEDSLRCLDLVRPLVNCQLAIAGGLTAETVATALQKGTNIMVIGSSITNQPDPGRVACAIMEKLRGYTTLDR